MSYFFAEPAQHTLSITRKAHLQGNGRGPEPVKVIPLNAPGERSRLATPATETGRRGPRLATPATETCRQGPRLVAQMIEFPAGGASFGPEPFRETSGLVYVLEGRLQLDAGGMHEVLEAGDCACMESEMALAWSAAGKHRCRVLAVTPGAVRAQS
jgi:hypothetical protein